MSCRDYLKTKLAGATKIVNVKNPTDASMMTLKKKHEASRVFAFDGGEVGTSRVAMDMTANKSHLPTAILSSKKKTGAPADASAYTAYRGAQGIDDDAAYSNGGRKVIQGCCEESSSGTSSTGESYGPYTMINILSAPAFVLAGFTMLGGSSTEPDYNINKSAYISSGGSFPITINTTSPTCSATMYGTWAMDSSVSMNLIACVGFPPPPNMISTIIIGGGLAPSKWKYSTASDYMRSIKSCELTSGVHQGPALFAGERTIRDGCSNVTNSPPVFHNPKNLIAKYIPAGNLNVKAYFMRAPPSYQALGVGGVKLGDWVASKSVSFAYVERHHGNPNLGHKWAYGGRKGLPEIYGNWISLKINKPNFFSTAI